MHAGSLDQSERAEAGKWLVGSPRFHAITQFRDQDTALSKRCSNDLEDQGLG